MPVGSLSESPARWPKLVTEYSRFSASPRSLPNPRHTNAASPRNSRFFRRLQTKWFWVFNTNHDSLTGVLGIAKAKFGQRQKRKSALLVALAEALFDRIDEQGVRSIALNGRLDW